MPPPLRLRRCNWYLRRGGTVPLLRSLPASSLLLTSPSSLLRSSPFLSPLLTPLNPLLFSAAFLCWKFRYLSFNIIHGFICSSIFLVSCFFHSPPVAIYSNDLKNKFSFRRFLFVFNFPPPQFLPFPIPILLALSLLHPILSSGASPSSLPPSLS